MALATTYDVHAGESCEQWVNVPPHGRFPQTVTCLSQGVYQGSSCEEAYQILEHLQNCCHAQFQSHRTGFNRMTCKEMGKSKSDVDLQVLLESYMMGGSPGAIKMHHVKGRHQCQSHWNLGYSCDVELRDATDCTSGHGRLRNQNCCGQVWIDGKQQTGGVSINYTPVSCSKLW